MPPAPGKGPSHGRTTPARPVLIILPSTAPLRQIMHAEYGRCSRHSVNHHSFTPVPRERQAPPTVRPSSPEARHNPPPDSNPCRPLSPIPERYSGVSRAATLAAGQRAADNAHAAEEAERQTCFRLTEKTGAPYSPPARG